MDFIVNYYFDFKNFVFSDGNFDAILQGFWVTIKLSILSGILSLHLGTGPLGPAPAPGRALAPVRWLTIAYIDVFRGIPLLLVLLLVSGFSVFGAPIGGEVLPEWLATPDLARRALAVLVRGLRADDHLRRLHGRGLPSRDRVGARAARWRPRARSA